MDRPRPEVCTVLLDRLNEGDDSAASELLPLVYDELRVLAGQIFSRSRVNHTLQATALVHEAYLKLIGASGNRKEWDGRVHFFAVAATAMRRVLTDYARRDLRDKRGGGAKRVTIDESLLEGSEESNLDLVDLAEALTELETFSERMARVVELRVFGGLTVVEVAQELDCTERTVFKDWRAGRAMLRRLMGGEGP
ncbi:MAG: ECF-type sigma factor [Planctomycetota bacterium]